MSGNCCWGTKGEGIKDAQNDPDFGMLMVRFIYNDPEWKQSLEKVTIPGTEAKVMGEYLPRGEYTTKAAFEAKGPR